MRRVVITGIGAISPHGLTAADLWAALVAGKSAVKAIDRFDASPFPSRIAGAAPTFKTTDFVPKAYRKATKIMARDIELAVVAADGAVRDARLATKGVVESGGAMPDASWSRVDPARIGCNIGAGLISADLDELTSAMVAAENPDHTLSLARWGRSEDAARSSGMELLTPLWLLKYLPNMPACHVSIIHDTRGPSNTITCGQASAGLALGEACRSIQRGKADVALVGGCETRVHPMGLIRWTLLNRLTTVGNENASAAVRPLDQGAAGTAVAEGGAVLVLEELDHARRRGAKIYCEVVGLGATATGRPPDQPDAGHTLLAAGKRALAHAGITPQEVQAVMPPAYGVPQYDAVDARVLHELFAGRPPAVTTLHGGTGDCGAGAQAIDLAAAALCLHHQRLFATINCEQPVGDLPVVREGRAEANLRHALVLASSLGGQNSAVLLRRMESNQ